MMYTSDTPNHITDRRAAVEWARAILADGTALVLDSETTGLSSDAQLVELCVCDLAGYVLLDTRIKPTCVIPSTASRIHGIYAADVADAPSFDAIYEQIAALLNSRHVLIFNAEYDTRVIRYCCEIAGLELLFKRSQVECVMLQYSAWLGDWNSYYQSYRYKRLPAAPNVKAHSALGDVLSTIAVIKEMAGVQ